MEKKAEVYFDECEEKKRKITITGLCYSLGFESKQSFYDYEKDPKFSYTIKRLRLRIESVYESLLQGPSPTGPIFALKQWDWRDKQEVEHSGKIESNLSGLSTEELIARANALKKIEGSEK